MLKINQQTSNTRSYKDGGWFDDLTGGITFLGDKAAEFSKEAVAAVANPILGEKAGNVAAELIGGAVPYLVPYYNYAYMSAKGAQDLKEGNYLGAALNLAPVGWKAGANVGTSYLYNNAKYGIKTGFKGLAAGEDMAAFLPRNFKKGAEQVAKRNLENIAETGVKTRGHQIKFFNDSIKSSHYNPNTDVVNIGVSSKQLHNFGEFRKLYKGPNEDYRFAIAHEIAHPYQSSLGVTAAGEMAIGKEAFFTDGTRREFIQETQYDDKEFQKITKDLYHRTVQAQKDRGMFKYLKDSPSELDADLQGLLETGKIKQGKLTSDGEAFLKKKFNLTDAQLEETLKDLASTGYARQLSIEVPSVYKGAKTDISKRIQNFMQDNIDIQSYSKVNVSTKNVMSAVRSRNVASESELKEFEEMFKAVNASNKKIWTVAANILNSFRDPSNITEKSFQAGLKLLRKVTKKSSNTKYKYEATDFVDNTPGEFAEFLDTSKMSAYLTTKDTFRALSKIRNAANEQRPMALEKHLKPYAYTDFGYEWKTSAKGKRYLDFWATNKGQKYNKYEIGKYLTNRYTWDKRQALWGDQSVSQKWFREHPKRRTPELHHKIQVNDQFLSKGLELRKKNNWTGPLSEQQLNEIAEAVINSEAFNNLDNLQLVSPMEHVALHPFEADRKLEKIPELLKVLYGVQV